MAKHVCVSRHVCSLSLCVWEWGNTPTYTKIAFSLNTHTHTRTDTKRHTHIETCHLVRRSKALSNRQNAVGGWQSDTVRIEIINKSTVHWKETTTTTTSTRTTRTAAENATNKSMQEQSCPHSSTHSMKSLWGQRKEYRMTWNTKMRNIYYI